MSLEQFKVQLELAGCNKEQIDNAMEEIYKAVWEVAENLEEVMHQIQVQLVNAFESITETFEELSELFKEIDKEGKESFYVPYNPPRDNSWYKQYMRKTMNDKREDIKYFTVNKRI